MKVILRLQTDTLVTEIPVEANKTITIGRSSKNNSYKIPDELMSGQHCRVTYFPPKLEIVDLESKNGTYLNGLRIEASEIFMGDEVKMGGTKLTIFSEKMEQNVVNALTFPGAARDRQSHGLTLDFTGARMINQSLSLSHSGDKRPTQSANKELEVRKKAHSNIKLSKHEIKLRNKKTASLAAIFDVIGIIFSFAFPLIAINLIFIANPNLVNQNRLMIILGAVSICVVLFNTINFNILKFTIGERLAGIKALYMNQG